ncbi:hypothetical protein [Streptomyces sp. NPDC047928]|uniref:hypothetical protein n=1 Tax=unclassified Streptomyces TaxID=2593676 RepID=UPI003721B3F1
MTIHRRRGLLRGAAVTVALGGALLAPAASALADDPAGDPVGVLADGPAAHDGATAYDDRTAHDIGTARDRTTLLLAGGGVATLGAAGMGYAMLSHGRTDT